MSGPEDNPADDDPHHECAHEIERLQALTKGLAETMSRVYCRLQCADVPREPWQNEVSVWLLQGSVRDHTDPEMHEGLPPITERDAAAMQAVIETLWRNKATSTYDSEPLNPRFVCTFCGKKFLTAEVRLHHQECCSPANQPRRDGEVND